MKKIWLLLTILIIIINLSYSLDQHSHHKSGSTSIQPDDNIIYNMRFLENGGNNNKKSSNPSPTPKPTAKATSKPTPAPTSNNKKSSSSSRTPKPTAASKTSKSPSPTPKPTAASKTSKAPASKTTKAPTKAPKTSKAPAKSPAPKKEASKPKTTVKPKTKENKKEASKSKAKAKGKGKDKPEKKKAKGKGKGKAKAKGKSVEKKETKTTETKKPEKDSITTKSYRLLADYPTTDDAIKSTQKTIETDLCKMYQPPKDKPNSPCPLKVLSLKKGSIIVTVQGVLSAMTALDEAIKNPANLPGVWSNVDPNYGNTGPVSVENHARDDPALKQGLTQLKQASPKKGGAVLFNRLLQAASLTCEALLAVDVTVRNNVQCNVLQAQLAKAKTVASDVCICGALEAMSGTIIIDAELLLTHSNPSLQAASFIAENIVVDGVHQWKLVHHDDFENGAKGWSLLETSSCSGKDHFLGGHCNIGNGQVTKTYHNLPPHKQIRLAARYHFIDKWNGETAFLKIGEHYSWVHRHESTSTNGINMCGGDYPEEKMSSPIDVVQAHSTSFLQVSFGSKGNPNQSPCERSFGVDDVMLYVR